MARTHYHCDYDVPELGLRAGDLLSYDPGDAWEPYLLHRAVHVTAGPLQRALQRALADGRMVANTPAPAPVRAPRAVRPTAGATVIPIGPRLDR